MPAVLAGRPCGKATLGNEWVTSTELCCRLVLDRHGRRPGTDAAHHAYGRVLRALGRVKEAGKQTRLADAVVRDRAGYGSD
jgi:hypothetical protein